MDYLRGCIDYHFSIPIFVLSLIFLLLFGFFVNKYNPRVSIEFTLSNTEI